MDNTVPPESIDKLLVLWAKLARKKERPRSWLPLLYHLLDVAAVAEGIWDAVLSPWVRRRIAAAMGLDEATARKWYIFLAASHDIGKASPAFAHLRTIPQELRQQIEDAGLPPVPRAKIQVMHGAVSTHVLNDELRAPRFGVSSDIVSTLATAVGGHHGLFPSRGQAGNNVKELIGNHRWVDAHRRLLHELADLLELPRNRPPLQIDNSAAMWLAGFVSVADWIGSNERYFRHAVADVAMKPVYNPVYIVSARENAAKALQRLGWIGWTPSREQRSFKDLFPNLAAYEPVPMQQAVIDLSAVASQGSLSPTLAIIEAPMGEGKTEAALYLADRWGITLGQSGLYFALPSQATSNQMFRRVRKFLGRRYPKDVVNLQLLHGHAALSGEVHLRRENDNQAYLFEPGGVAVDEDDEDHKIRARVSAAEWFTYRKRGLLSPFGVGTIDQALMAILSTPHVFVRLFGLTGKVVVVDEVHAYDAYMSHLLRQLLRWLGALGCSVVLLSATLPTSRREGLVKAYREGVGTAPSSEPKPEGSHEPEPYPRITWAPADGPVMVRHVAASEHKRKTLYLTWVDGEPKAIAARLRVALADGGCAAVICNSVGRAQKVYRAVKAAFADPSLPLLSAEIDLLHGRFPFEDRAEREKQVLDRFGEDDNEANSEANDRQVKRPLRAVLVATQIIEQSLDIDFDLMVTDLAPVDLLLQRSGRLHRHRHTFPPHLRREAHLWVCSPQLKMDGVLDEPRDNVYDEHVLLRSWLVLRGRTRIEVPGDIEPLVKAVYDELEPPTELTAAERARWKETREEQGRAIKSDEGSAKDSYIKAPGYDGGKALLDSLVGHPKREQEDAPELHPVQQAKTRLAEPSVDIVCLYGTRERATLDAAGTQVVDLAVKPDQQLTMRLLGRSLSVSLKHAVGPLRAEPIPQAWKRAALLRWQHPVFFDSKGYGRVGNVPLRLDQEEGLLIGRTGDKEV